jgi:hypothetical protein
MNEQALLYGVAVIVLTGTLVVFGVAWWRNRGRDDE